MERTRGTIKLHVTEEDAFSFGITKEEMREQRVIDDAFLLDTVSTLKIQAEDADCKLFQVVLQGKAWDSKKIATFTYFIRGAITARLFVQHLEDMMGREEVCNLKEIYRLSKGYNPAGINASFDDFGSTANTVYQKEDEEWEAGFFATEETLNAYGVDTSIIQVHPLHDIRNMETYNYVKEKKSDGGTDWLEVVSFEVSTELKSEEYVELTLSLTLKEKKNHKKATLNFIGFLDLTTPNGNADVRVRESDLVGLASTLAEELLEELNEAMYIDIEMVFGLMANHATPLRLKALV